MSEYIKKLKTFFNKNSKKIIINLIILVLVYLLLEAYAATVLYKRYQGTFKDIRNLPMIIKLFNPQTYDSGYRPPLETENSDKKSVIVFGCSFAYGFRIGDAFGEKLHALTGRNVYNRSQECTGPQMMLYQLQHPEKLFKLTKNCGYIIYVYAADAEDRGVKYRCCPISDHVIVRYKLMKNDALKLQTINLYKTYSFIYRLMEESFPQRFGNDYCNKLFYEMIKQSYELSQKIYPNSKFIILNYTDHDVTFGDELKKIGIEIISLPDLTKENMFQLKYQVEPYDTHPNEKAWSLITPLLIKRTGM